MKIWIVTLDWAEDCDSNVAVKPFRNETEARELFNKLADDYRAFAKDGGWVVEDDTPNYFGVFQDGYACQNHTYIILKEYKI